ncbi:MAG: nitroreductase family protein [Dehalococcoidia bacterium]|nr:nitroreductase family protein [Dehalococcoidia bacterium]
MIPRDPAGRFWLDTLIQTRRSVRSFTEAPLDATTVRSLIDAARWAPSPHNSQPWRFAIVGPGAARVRLAEAMADRWRADLAHHGETTPELLRLVETRRRRLLTAPAAVIAALTADDLDVYPDEARRAAEWLTAEHSLGAAVQNLLLAAHARGIGSCWICAPAFCPDTVRSALDLPSAWTPRALVLLGYPARPPKEPSRRDLDAIIVERV